MKMYKLGCALLVAASAFITAQATPIVSVLDSSTVDLNGNFVYALTMNPYAAGTTVGNAKFTYALGGATTGVTVSHQNYIQNWHSNTNTTAAGLDAVMKSIIWSGGSGNAQTVTLTMANLVIGNTYKAQLMFGEACCNRGFDIYQNDVKVWDDFSAYGLGGNNSNGNGLFSNTFIATSSTLKFGLGYNGNRPDWNPILNAATLENVNSVPAPASLGLLLAGFAAVAVARKKRQ